MSDYHYGTEIECHHEFNLFDKLNLKFQNDKEESNIYFQIFWIVYTIFNDFPDKKNYNEQK